MQTRFSAAVALAIVVAAGIYASAMGASSASSIPRCRSSQLSHAVDSPIGPELGPTVWVVLTNSSRQACSLPEAPPRAWVTWRGRLLRTREKHRLGIRPAAWYPLRPIRVLEPDARAGVTLEWRNWCAAPRSKRVITRIHLRFESGAGLSFPLGPPPACLSKGSPSTLLVSRPLDAR